MGLLYIVFFEKAEVDLGESQASWATKIYFEISCDVLNTDS